MIADVPEAGGDRGRQVALGLMRMALALLDREGELLAAARLQHAIDTLRREEPTDVAGD